MFVEKITKARNPVLAAMGSGSEHRFGDAGVVEAIELPVAAKFLDAKIGWVYRMRVNQNRGNAGSSQHCRRGRTGKSTSDDGNVCVLHGTAFQFRAPHHCSGKANKALASSPGLIGCLSGLYYPGRT